MRGTGVGVGGGGGGGAPSAAGESPKQASVAAANAARSSAVVFLS